MWRSAVNSSYCYGPLRICCRSQSAFVAIYGHNCLYTENMLFSSFSIVSDLASAPAAKVLQIIIAGDLFSAWITGSLVSIQRQCLDPHAFLTHLLFQQVKLHLICRCFQFSKNKRVHLTGYRCNYLQTHQVLSIRVSLLLLSLSHLSPSNSHVAKSTTSECVLRQQFLKSCLQLTCI